MKTEVRFVAGVAGQEVRMIEGKDGKPSMIEGYAAIYDSPSEDLGGFIEVVKPGAFARSLAQGSDVLGRYNHAQMLGRRKSGTLRLFDEPKGLRYQIDIPDTTVGRDTAVSIARGDVEGSSFEFRVMGTDGETWRREGGKPLRELRALTLLDVGPVDRPAYSGTEGNVGLRSLPADSRKLAEELILPLGIPNRRHALLKLAELGERRFYVADDGPGSACADACMQACSALDSLMSLLWKTQGGDDLRPAVADAMTLCQATAGIVVNEESMIIGELAGVTAKALLACVKTCKGMDNPVAKLAVAVCQQAAGQCGALNGAEDA